MVDIKNLNVKFFANNECISRYLNDIRKFKVLTPQEEEEEFTKMTNGNEHSRTKIINSNQRFVFSMAKRYAKNEDEVLDYVNEGNIGLIEAINAFDPSKGYKFITFAVWYIQRSMNYYFMVTNNIVKRSNAMKIGKKVDTIREKAYATTGSIPTNEEIIEILKNEHGIVIKDISDIADMNVESINSELTDDYEMEDSSDFNQATATENDYEKEVEREDNAMMINDILEELPANFAEIIKMHFGIGMERAYTDEEIAEKMEMYSEDIANIINNTLKYLRQEYGNLVV